MQTVKGNFYNGDIRAVADETIRLPDVNIVGSQAAFWMKRF